MIFANVYLNDKYYLSSKCDIFAKIYGREETVSIPYNKLSAIIIYCFQQKIRKIKITKLSILNGTDGVY